MCGCISWHIHANLSESQRKRWWKNVGSDENLLHDSSDRQLQEKLKPVKNIFGGKQKIIVIKKGSYEIRLSLNGCVGWNPCSQCLPWECVCLSTLWQFIHRQSHRRAELSCQSHTHTHTYTHTHSHIRTHTNIWQRARIYPRDML